VLAKAINAGIAVVSCLRSHYTEAEGEDVEKRGYKLKGVKFKLLARQSGSASILISAFILASIDISLIASCTLCLTGQGA
jgi:hypothetical protein